MKLRLFGCGRFSHLLAERDDRALTEGEELFLSRHRDVCSACRSFESLSDTSLDLLRSLAFDADEEVTPNYDQKLIRRVKITQGRQKFSYWFPAIVGAGIASLAVFAIIQLASGAYSFGPDQKHFSPTGSAEMTQPKPNSRPRLIIQNLK